MNEVQIFNNAEFGKIRTVIIDGEPWFVAKDISEKLGYSKTFSMTKQIDDEDKQIFDTTSQEDADFNSKTRNVGIINESGLYNAIFGSKLESAKRFKKWVTSEVLPSIRKTGGYKAPMTIPEQIQLLAQGNVELNKRVDTLEERFIKFEDDLPLFQRDTKEVQNAVKKKDLEILGGKNSNAYHDKSVRTCVFSDIQCQLRRNFDVRRYEEIRHKRINDALRIVEEYKAPLVLMEKVQFINAQQTLNI